MVNVEAKKKELENALIDQDAQRLAKVFRLPSIFPSKDNRNLPQPRKHNVQSLYVGEYDHGPLLASLMDATAAAEDGNVVATFEAQTRVHSTFNRLLSSSEGNWLIPALIVICKNTNQTAIVADQHISLTSKIQQHHHQAKLEKASPILQESYSKTINDRTEYHPGSPFDTIGSKQSGVLAIVNELFNMYFRLNNLRLCNNLIRPVETKKLQEKGTMAEMITYRYYSGRLNMFEDQHERAETHLDYALQHCHKNAISNKKRILKYLVPIKLFRGRLPTTLLLDKYGLEEFKPIVKGIRKGDFRTFQDGLVQYQDRFVRQGTYLLLEKCKTVCYRNLFKRVHKILDKHHMSLNRVAKVFKWLGMPIDLDEIECILANLIFQGFVRGYLSHSKRTLVLSKRDPFP